MVKTIIIYEPILMVMTTVSLQCVALSLNHGAFPILNSLKNIHGLTTMNGEFLIAAVVVIWGGNTSVQMEAVILTHSLDLLKAKFTYTPAKSDEQCNKNNWQ